VKIKELGLSPRASEAPKGKTFGWKLKMEASEERKKESEESGGDRSKHRRSSSLLTFQGRVATKGGGKDPATREGKEELRGFIGVY